MDNAVMVPVRTATGVEFLPLAEDETPTFLVVVKPEKAALLTTSDPNGDRIAVGAATVEGAVGWVLMHNPGLRYEDVLDHMEV